MRATRMMLMLGKARWRPHRFGRMVECYRRLSWLSWLSMNLCWMQPMWKVGLVLMRRIMARIDLIITVWTLVVVRLMALVALVRTRAHAVTIGPV